MTTAFARVLEQIRSSATSNKDLGDKFERVAQIYFESDKTQQQHLGKVWSFADWAAEQGIDRKDVGVDLVAELRNEEGEFAAIQAKCYQSNHRISKNDVNSFFAFADAKRFSRRILVDTSEVETSQEVIKLLEDSHIPGSRVQIQDFQKSSIDWNRWLESQEIRETARKTPMPHQLEAVEAVKNGFVENDRGQVIMACGTGKTYTGLLLAERLVGVGGRVLILVPSLALMAQSVREWTNDANLPLRSYAVCSDAQVGKYGKRQSGNLDRILENSCDLALPATTNAGHLSKQASQSSPDTLTLIFGTYHSLGVIEQAQKNHDLPDFDLILCDEAHRTTGQIKEDKEASNFVIVHDQNRIRGNKRLYMTATPRIYTESAARQAKGAIQLASMDDDSRFGPVFFVRNFVWAIQNDLLTDYQVVVLTISEQLVSNSVHLKLSDDKSELTLELATRIVGCYKALMKHSLDKVDFSHDPQPCKSALVFSNTIKRSKQVQQNFGDVVDEFRSKCPNDVREGDPDCQIEHVDGSTPSKLREGFLDWLAEEPAVKSGNSEIKLLSNVRCLSEGVDVPSLDAVVFLDARTSQIDVVQAIGRVMRKAEGKKMGYVILPIAIPANKTPEEALNDNKRYRVVWQILNALRSHDERIEGLIASLEFGELGSDSLKILYGHLGESALIDSLRSQEVGPGPTNGEGNGDDNENGSGSSNGEPDLFEEINAELARAISARLVKKCGVTHTWVDWAADIERVAQTHISRISSTIHDETNPQNQGIFATFLAELQDDLNPSVTASAAVEMLAQHLITKPVFDAVFQSDQFTSSNSISQAMDSVVEGLKLDHLETERESLESFYSSISNRVAEVKTSYGKQQLIRNLYEKFFQNAFKKLTEQLGIVYTPIEVVDYILKSVNYVCREHFQCSLGDQDVKVLDPFVGTGTFLTRLLDDELDLVPKENLLYKYQFDIHANEIVPLAYYIAGINIESVVHQRLEREEYVAFEGLCLADTFHSTEEKFGLLDSVFPLNHIRTQIQLDSPIQVIVSNPPYSKGQRSGDDNAANVPYPRLDARIRGTYVANSLSSNKNSLYDSYVRAIRWASDRLRGRGVIGFVTNAGWLDSVAGSGVRGCVAKEFSKVFVFQLRGNQRTSGELSRREGGKIFGAGSRAPIAITILVKDPKHHGDCEIFYHDIGDYLTREQKLERIQEFGSIEATGWTQIQPDKHFDWLNQRQDDFESFGILSEEKGAKRTDPKLFEFASIGIKSNRDTWAFNFSEKYLVSNIKKTFETFNQEVDRHRQNQPPKETLKRWVRSDATKIHWSRDFFQDLTRERKKAFDARNIRVSVYRPFVKSFTYLHRSLLNEPYQQPRLFPNRETKNRLICIQDLGNNTPFSCLMVDSVPDLHLFGSTFSVPLEFSEFSENPGILRGRGTETRSAFSPQTITRYENAYPHSSINEETVFCFIYGLFHAAEYRNRYRENLNKQRARVPWLEDNEDFNEYSRIGKLMGDLHVDYEFARFPESVEVNGTAVDETELNSIAEDRLKVKKMAYSKNGKQIDRTKIHFNEFLTVTNIPLDAYEYVVNGKSAIDWIVDRYQITTHKKSNITNDPNDYAREIAKDPAYILKLLLRIITVSLETNKLVAELPPLRIREDQSL